MINKHLLNSSSSYDQMYIDQQKENQPKAREKTYMVDSGPHGHGYET